ncbi:MAG TPA: hypothetical protein VGQ83_20780, partial [Polyangia bacterium]
PIGDASPAVLRPPHILLRGRDDELTPVRWTSHNGTLGDCQGELLQKPRLGAAAKSIQTRRDG